MPITYNGVGTRYAGKRNVETRTAQCRSCGRHLTLASYDTRLWFVVLYIPIIPLGRKHIVDECPACRRHYVVDADKWETQKQLGISGATETYEANPTPEAAMALHQTMLDFHQSAQAAEFRREMVEKFGENAHVHAYLGEALSRAGNAAEGAQHFTRALELRPDLPEARAGVARQHIAANRLDDARALLDFLETPGAEHLHPLEPLKILADAYQRAGQHATARELYEKLLAALPAIGQIAAFRKKVRVSEKALRPRATILPKRNWSWKNFFGSSGAAAGSRWRGLGVLGILLLLVGAGFIIANEYIRRHRAVYIVNATDAAQVQIESAATTRTLRVVGKRAGQRAAPPGVEQIEIPEGRYRVHVGGAAGEPFDFEVRTGYWERWGGDPVWLLNIGGAALLIETRATYRSAPPPATYVLHFGKTHDFLPGITHPFKELPTTLQLKSGQERDLAKLEPARDEPIAWIEKLAFEKRLPEALDLAEWAVQRSPDDEPTLEAFVGLARQNRQVERADRVLKPGLARRPVRIAWHRQYQSLHLTPGEEGWLVVIYDTMLQAEPENSALLYLRGRLGPDGDAWFQRAHRADPQNPYASFALGYDRMALGDFAGARPLLASAVAGLPDSEGNAELFWQCRFALGEIVEPARKSRASRCGYVRPSGSSICSPRREKPRKPTRSRRISPAPSRSCRSRRARRIRRSSAGTHFIRRAILRRWKKTPRATALPRDAARCFKR